MSSSQDKAYDDDLVSCLPDECESCFTNYLQLGKAIYRALRRIETLLEKDSKIREIRAS